MNELKILDMVWERQLSFNKNFDIETKDKQQNTKEMVLHLISEADELLRETNWKIHRKENKMVIESNLKEEWIDIFKYWLTIGQIWGFTPKDFIDEFERKSGVVEQRYEQEKKLSGIMNDKICAIDIDGVLADYPQSFLDFANKEFDMNWKLKDVPKSFDVPKAEYDKIKHSYRESGQKRFIQVKKGAKEMLDRLKQSGYTIILLTARPYKKYKRIFADTKEWLDKNELVYDAIIWDEQKNERVVKEFPHLSFMIEDSYSNAKSIAELDYKVFWIRPSYDMRVAEETTNIIEIKSLDEVN